ncbi:hypothetical protein [Chitiniphilus eburneus]|uniref:Uncharacterized protein n=1 Tax=Chitiniphilus eburneus TaxID=2571148 RepID=A0A4U0QCK8_9NEIS|nr:hypothetical protein [Chitiniphilus eburneus]TJZ79181.1 hypothetical protein FAZ21_02530 [Chitiniphilus eburneus]
MKRPQSIRGAGPGDQLTNQFVRGATAAGLLLAMQPPRASGKAVLRHALRGGTALAAGVATANAVQRRAYGEALLSVALGAAGLAAIDYVLNQQCLISEKDRKNG